MGALWLSGLCGSLALWLSGSMGCLGSLALWLSGSLAFLASLASLASLGSVALWSQWACLQGRRRSSGQKEGRRGRQNRHETLRYQDERLLVFNPAETGEHTFASHVDL